MTAKYPSGYSTRPSPTVDGPAQVARMRTAVLGTLAAAFLLEVFSRYLHASSQFHPLVSEVLSLVALSLLCGSALYPIYSIEDTPLIRWSMTLATVFLMTSQLIRISEDALDAAGMQVPESLRNLLPLSTALFLLAGLILMVATLYLALFETIATRAALVHERADLVAEIVERKQAQTALHESRNLLRSLSAHLENVREDERAKVARELHDELGQTLTSLKIDLANLKLLLRREPHPVSEDTFANIAAMSDLIDGTMKSVRRIITELRPGILDDLGLFAAVEWQARDFQKRTGIPCVVTALEAEIPLSRDSATALFRIFQETLTNAARHAEAKHVTARFGVTEDYIVLEVADDGKGMLNVETEQKKSFGLMGIRERALQFGGTLRIDSRPGAGTRITVSLPLINSEFDRVPARGHPTLPPAKDVHV